MSSLLRYALAGSLIPAVLSAQAAPLASSDVADAVEGMSARRAHLTADIRRLAGEHLFGPAVTMRIVRDDQASLRVEGLKAIQVVQEAPAGSVIFVCSDGDRDFAVFGATFATLAKSRGLAGFVVDGAMRGVADLRRIGVPVFARGTVAGSAGGHYRLESVNDTVGCGGVQVSPGDFVVGDEDGVSVIPKAISEAAIAKARALRDEKEKMLPLIAKLRSYTKAVEEYQRLHPKPRVTPSSEPHRPR
jgi:4-hydroxy-4-methyl-2-oxoglutarate aldolase